METEPDEVRFGVIVVRMGFESPDQTVKALEIQVRQDLSTVASHKLGLTAL